MRLLFLGQFTAWIIIDVMKAPRILQDVPQRCEMVHLRCGAVRLSRPCSSIVVQILDIALDGLCIYRAQLFLAEIRYQIIGCIAEE